MSKKLLLLLLIPFYFISCNKWELVKEVELKGNAECIDKQYQASQIIVHPIYVNKVVINSTSYIPVKYSVLFNCSFEDFECSKEISNKDLYARYKIGQTFSCSVIKSIYFCEEKNLYKNKYKNLHIDF